MKAYGLLVAVAVLVVLILVASPAAGHKEENTELADALRELAALIVDEMYEADQAVESAGIAMLRAEIRMSRDLNETLLAENDMLWAEIIAAVAALEACQAERAREAESEACAACLAQCAAHAEAQAACQAEGRPCADQIDVASCSCPRC